MRYLLIHLEAMHLARLSGNLEEAWECWLAIRHHRWHAQHDPCLTTT